MKADETNGIYYGQMAFLLWGMLPLYWKQLGFVPAAEVLSNRILWSTALLIILVRLSPGRSAEVAMLRDPRVLGRLTLSSLLVGINWLVFVWAIGSGQALEASIGYFICPVFTALLGVIIHKERVTPAQAITFSCASSGVVTLSLAAGHVPWIALALATSWGFYSLVRKGLPIDSIVALAVETAILAPIACLYLYSKGSGHLSISQHLLLIGAGPITVLPLLCFGEAVKRVKLVTLGTLQYINPCTQLLISIVLFHENFTAAHRLALAGIVGGIVLGEWLKRRAIA